ncbi:MAG: hypothetical protein HQL53_11585 [Magnetococcales bacterium]|nr:hypothetical protein [Magnetococcales bacterium]
MSQTSPFERMQSSHDLSFKTKRKKRRKGRSKLNMKSRKRSSSPEAMVTFLRALADQIEQGDLTPDVSDKLSKFKGGAQLREKTRKRTTQSSVRIKLKWRSKSPKEQKAIDILQDVYRDTLDDSFDISDGLKVGAVGSAAGLGLAGTAGVAADTVEAVSDASEAVSDSSGIMDVASDLVGHASDAVGDVAGDAIDSSGDLMDDAADTVGDVAGSTVDAISDTTSGIGDLVGEAVEAVSGVAEESVDAVSDAAGSASSSVRYDGDMFSGFGIPGVEDALTLGLQNLEGDAAATLEKYSVSAQDDQGNPRPIMAVINDLKEAGASGNDLLAFLIWLIENPVRSTLGLSSISTAVLVKGVTALFS